MKEGVFLRRNKKKWEAIEQETRNVSSVHPDRLGEIFIELCDDLSYARTHHSNSPIAKYLNTLTARIHQTIYKQQNIRFSQIAQFWTRDVPLVMVSVRKQMLVSFVIFAISCAIGVISTLNDKAGEYEFARGILGDAYVEMTLQNIKEGKPMAVYENKESIPMFLAIAYNNIRVAFMSFAWGGFASILGVYAFFFLSIGSAYILFVNGVMVGTFQTLFYKENLLWESASVIWLHGTIEIWSIVLAGGAGIVMGNSIFFPKTYSRRESFRRGAEKAGKIMLSLLPFITLAAFIESFVTRYADMHVILKLLIILGSLALVVFYFVIYPFIVEKREEMRKEQEKIELPSVELNR
ncbi:stage II sporulation protein M [Raineya orbicola]|uniref:Integral membrane protein n=1 Tax=Raineya orbicola TaxID=2016530 RepID=A0A2N3IH75_9BACT|nr:stage II sporulation protein M [Raineya orbicola]PKQ69641.1 Integral membrane protein [Raineya orbicola]